MKKSINMQQKSISSLAICALLLAVQAPIIQALEISDTSFTEDEFIAPDGGITLTLDTVPTSEEGRLAVFIDTTDLTELFQLQDNTLVYPTDAPPLPPGGHEIIVFLVPQDDEEWQEVARLPLQILTASGFQEAEITPTLDIAINSQIAANYSGDAETPERGETFTDLEMQAGLETRHVRDDWELNSSFAVSGFSLRENALRFAEEEEDAQKVDLAEYLVELKKGAATGFLGHVTYGNHPLLLDNVNHRGVAARYQFNDRFDFSLAAMNGTSIVGFENIFGLNDHSDHHIAGATFGFELLPSRPGGLRTEFTYMDGIKRNELDFDVGEIGDAEESDGFGIRVIGSSESGRLRGEVNFARSQYTNPDDPVLDPNGEVVDVRTSTDNAYTGQIAYDILQDQVLFGEQAATFTASGSYAYADALYNSLGASVEANVETYTLGLDGFVGDVSMQLAYRHAEDNVDDVPTLLTTRTRSWNFTLGVPLKTMIGDEENPQWWIPDIAYSFERVHQEAVNTPDPELSGFDDPSQLPDQITRVDALDFVWTTDQWDATYRFAFSDEDNRQTGREDADFKTTENSITVNLRPLDVLNLNFGAGRVRNRDEEQKLNRYTDNYTVGIDWAIAENWTLSGSYSFTDEDDDDNIAQRDSTSAQAQLSWRFEVPSPDGRKLPGQWFIRYNLEDQNEKDNEFEVDTSATSWTINTGFSLSLF